MQRETAIPPDTRRAAYPDRVIPPSSPLPVAHPPAIAPPPTRRAFNITPPAVVEAMRQEYMSGTVTLEELAHRFGLGVRTVKKYSKEGQWAGALRVHQLTPQVQTIAQAVNRRVEAVSQRWRERVESILDTVARIAETEIGLLERDRARDESKGKPTTWQDRARLIYLLSDTLEKLRRSLPPAPAAPAQPDDEEANQEQRAAAETARERIRTLLANAGRTDA